MNLEEMMKKCKLVWIYQERGLIKIQYYFINQDYFSSILSYLSPEGTENEKTKKFMSLTLLSCFKNIDYEYITEVNVYLKSYLKLVK